VTFILSAGLLCLLAMGFVLIPWLRHRAQLDPAHDRRDATVDIVRTRLLELEREWRDGVIDEATYQSLKVEQERRLLDEVKGLEHSQKDHRKKTASKNRWIFLLAIIAIPVFAALLYRHVGGWLDWSIEETMQCSQQMAESGQDNRATLESLAVLLERRLAQRDDDDGRRRFTLARLQTELGNQKESLNQFRILIEKFPNDADLAGQYAQALYLASGRQLSPEVSQAAQRALSLNPDQPTALGLLGIAAFEKKDYAQALMNWRRLLRQLPVGSRNAELIQRGIDQAQAGLGADGLPGPKIAVSVTLSPELQQIRGTLFVFAKAVDGPPLPLAVARFDNPSLPLSVTLDDSMAMAAGMNLSSFKKVQVFARITASGQVRGEAGDLEGSSAPLELSDKTLPVAVIVERRL